MVRRRERELGQTTSAQEFHWDDVKYGLKDWKIYAFCAGQFGADTMLYGYSTFLPTIIKGINSHWSSAIIQVLTIPCYALGAITYLITAWISDRYQRRGIPTVILCLISVVGYAMLMSNSSSGVHYTGCFLVAMGLYVAVGIPLAWLPSNNPRYGKRTTASGLQLTIGNTSGIMAPFVSAYILFTALVAHKNQVVSDERGSEVCPRTCCHIGISSLRSFSLWQYVCLLHSRQSSPNEGRRRSPSYGHEWWSDRWTWRSKPKIYLHDLMAERIQDLVCRREITR